MIYFYKDANYYKNLPLPVPECGYSCKKVMFVSNFPFTPHADAGYRTDNTGVEDILENSIRPRHQSHCGSPGAWPD